MTKPFPIPVNIPLFSGNEKKYLNECIDSGWISSEGAFVKKFEKQFSSYIGTTYGVAVSSGSGALDIAIQALGITDGDEVIMPTFTIISPAYSIIRAGAIPVLVDSDPLTWNMDVSQIEEKITAKTKAILVVHIYGLPAHMDPILTLAKKYNLKIIEDAAEMHGQTYFNKMCGSLGDISIFSFYPNKLIATGEGGMILCNDPSIAQQCSKLRNLAFEADAPRFMHNEIGWNYRMSNLQAALGVAQLEQIEQFIIKKRKIADYYYNELFFLTKYGYQLPLKSTEYAENINWVFGLIAPDVKEKDRLLSSLAERLIGTRPFFWCMHEQPVFKKRDLFNNESYPVAEHLARNGFYIPSGLGLSEKELGIVCTSFKEFYE